MLRGLPQSSRGSKVALELPTLSSDFSASSTVPLVTSADSVPARPLLPCCCDDGGLTKWPGAIKIYIFVLL